MSNQKKQEGEKQSGKQQTEKQETISPIFSHDPIIITGESSMFLLFDGPNEENYSLTNETNPTIYTSGDDLLITGVEVEVGTSGSFCPGVPSHGQCTIIIDGQRSGKPDSSIIVTGSDDGVEIKFNDKEYEKNGPTGHRRKYGHKDRKVKRLTIIDNVTHDVYDCQVPSNGKCTVVIHDDHLD